MQNVKGDIDNILQVYKVFCLFQVKKGGQPSYDKSKAAFDDEHDLEDDIEENEDEDPDWSGEPINEDEEEEDEADEDLDDADDPEWGPTKEDSNPDGKYTCFFKIIRFWLIQV